MKAAQTMGFTALIVWLVCIIGWISNVVQVVIMGVANNDLTTLFILKIIGIFLAPLGAIMGWIGFF